MKIINQTQKTFLGDQIEEAQTFSKRLFGLILSPNLKKGQGLFFPKCRSIHTWGMKYPIDVLMVDRNLKVLATFQSVKPFQVLRPRLKVRSTLELPQGTIRQSKTHTGDQLEIL